MLHLKSRLACRHFLSAWFRWIPLLGVRVLMASGSAMIHRNWCEEGDWHSSVQINTATSLSCDSDQITSVSAWFLSFVLITTGIFREGGGGWLCLMYFVDSDSILCKRDLFLKKSLFSIVRFYEVQKCWVYNMLLSIFDVCCTHKVRIKVEKERERLQLV